MQRRTFLRTTVAVTAAATIPTAANAATETIDPIVFDSTASLLAADGSLLTNESLVPVFAEPTAFNVDEDDDGDATDYGTTSIPLVASDDGVVGFGAPIGQDDTDFSYGNEEFLLNVLDEETDGETVLFDEGHGQFYDLDSFSAFADYAESNGYTVDATDSLTDELSSADAAIVTSPSDGFTDTELSAVESFVGDGGALLLFDQSDFGNFDATANLNEVASAADAGFSFNDDQVLDSENNAGPEFAPTTSQFDDSFDYFDEREGLGLELDPEQTYEVEIDRVTDGDTVDVQFSEGQTESVRLLGIDTPEKPANQFAERPEEWPGIESLEYLGQQGEEATSFAESFFEDATTATLAFDENEPVRDAFDRVLGYLTVDETQYNREAVTAGFARVYDSGFDRHDEFLERDRAARDAGRGVWAASDPADSPEIRNEPAESLFFPSAVPIEADDGETVVNAEQAAGGQPLVAVDERARIGLVGSPFIDESFESAEGYPVDTSDYGNFSVLASLADKLSARDGTATGLNKGKGHGDREPSTELLIDGGHGQLNGPGLSAEDAAYFGRFVEGVGLGFEGINDVTGGFGATLLDETRAFIVTSPESEFTDAEIDALRAFRDDGGAVLLLGGAHGDARRTRLNDLASALGTDLRFADGVVTDEQHNVNDDPTVPTTTVFSGGELFDGYQSEAKYKRGKGNKKNGSKGNGNGKRNAEERHR
ncbi:nuclease [Halobacteriales archaeon SW_6_65_46]|nr:MAG: nuclease [Halobacteriales archaeon SW_6_65_46]